MLYNVAQLLRHELETSRDVEIEGQLFDIDERNPGPVEVSGRAMLVRTPDGILAVGDAEMSLRDQCRRCLKEYETIVAFHFDEEFLPSLDILTGRMLLDKDTTESPELVISEQHVLDLSEPLRQFAVMELGGGLCDPGCKGLCSQCGEDLNLGPCACDSKAIDPRMAVLAQLLRNQEKESTD